MNDKYKYYFKILNDELFGGEGSEGYISLELTYKANNPIELAKGGLLLTQYSKDVEVVEISEKEYLKATAE